MENILLRPGRGLLRQRHQRRQRRYSRRWGNGLHLWRALKFSDVFSPPERQEYLRKARAAIRYATATRRTGTQKCPDGKQWGNSWQSAIWAGTLGFGAWLLWDELDPDLRKDSDLLYASYSDQPKHFKAGDSVAHRVVLLFTEISPEQTAAAAHFLRVEQQKEKKLLHFKLPKGGEADIELQ